MASFLVKLAMVCLVLGASSPMTQAAVTCGQVVSYLSPCISYIMNGGRTVPAQCCNGIRTLYGLAHTTPDRQSVCNCIKNIAKGFRYTNFNLNLAAGLPKKCGVNIHYQISPSIDCSRVQ